MKSLGRSTKAYLPLSLVITLIGVQPAVFAGSALDPYAHIQAPESPIKKKQTSVPSVDVVTPSTYVTMPMGGDPSALNPKKPGMFSGLKNPVAGLKIPFTGGKSPAPSSQHSIASGTTTAPKKSGNGLMKKTSSMIGNGFKATGNTIAGGTAKMASVSTSLLPGGKPKKSEHKSEIASNNPGSLNEMYVNKAKSNMDKQKEANKEFKTANQTLPSSTKEILAGQVGQPKTASKKSLIPSVSMPFMKKKPHDETKVAESNNGSGFLQGTMDKKSGAHDLRASKQLATSDSVKDKSETPVVSSAAPAQTKKKGLIPGMPSLKLKTPQIAGIPFMGKKKEQKQHQGGTVASQEKQSPVAHQIPVSPGAEAKSNHSQSTFEPIASTDPFPDVKPTAVAQHPGSQPAKKGGLLKMPSMKMPKIGIPGFGGKKAPQPNKEEVL